MVVPYRWVAILLALSFSMSCATKKEALRFDISQVSSERGSLVWPPVPEVPRFAYVGEITGEPNFSPAEGSGASIGRKIFEAIVGLGREKRQPMVLQRPQGGAVDEAGRIYVTDVSRQAVFFFDIIGGQLKVWDMARPGERFVAPIGVALGANGEILVTDSELGIVVRLGLDGVPLGSFGEGVLVRPTGIARDPERGRIYVADTRDNDIKVFDDQGVLVDVFAREQEEEVALNSPTYLTVAGGRVYVTDTLNARVQVFDVDGSFLYGVGERGLYVGNFSRPKGVGVDSDGHIYVVESYYDHLLVFDDEGRFLLPIGGTGHEPGEFYLPTGVWIDADDFIYVADMFNGRVCVFQFLGNEP